MLLENWTRRCSWRAQVLVVLVSGLAGACTGKVSGDTCMSGTACAATGATCTAPQDCRSGFCADGVCCDQACTDNCTSCIGHNTGKADGTCALVTVGIDPRKNCPDGSFCDGDGFCVPLGLGMSCSSDNECDLGFCTDGVCCDKRCQGTCERCSGAGLCTPVTSAPDKGGCDDANATAPCDAPPCACDASSTCKPGGGLVCGAGAKCAESLTCVEGVCCDTSCEGRCQSCLSSVTGMASGTCAPAMPGEDPDNECTGTIACDGTGQCFAKQLGDDCTGNHECLSGFCGVGGKCCNTACDSGCRSCRGADTGGSDGTCAPISNGLDPYDNCLNSLACDGSGICHNTPQGDACAHGYDCVTGHCIDGVCCNEDCSAKCMSCVAGQTGIASGTCAFATSGVDECSGNAVCNGAGACVSALGTYCLLGTDCLSGYCVDHVCCDSACTATCKACAAAYSTGPHGVCSPARDELDPHQQCDGGYCVSEQCQWPDGHSCTDDIQCVSQLCGNYWTNNICMLGFGGTCSIEGDCGSSNCDVGGSYTCMQTPKGDHGVCTHNIDCGSGHCDNRHCN